MNFEKIINYLIAIRENVLIVYPYIVNSDDYLPIIAAYRKIDNVNHLGDRITHLLNLSYASDYSQIFEKSEIMKVVTSQKLKLDKLAKI